MVRKDPWLVRVSLEDRDGESALGSLFVLSDSIVSREDLQTLWLWQSYKGTLVYYDIGVAPPAALPELSVQRVLGRLASSSAEHPYVHVAGSDAEGLAVLEWLHDGSYVQRGQVSAADASWWLSQFGYRSLGLSQTLHAHVLLVEHAEHEAEGKPFDDKSLLVFQLLLILEREGWICKVKPKGRKPKKKPKKSELEARDLLEWPEDYVHGNAKVFWVRLSDDTLSAWYLRALCTAEKRPEQPVAHFLKSWQYEELVTGKARRRNPTGGSMFCVRRDSAEAPNPTIEFEAGAGGRDGHEDPSFDGDADSAAVGSTSDAASESGSGAGSPSSKRSPSSSSSSSSSSSTSSGARTSAYAGVGSDSDGGGGGGAPDGTARRHGTGGALLGTSFVWKHFLFTCTWSPEDKGQVNGWQCACCIEGHSGCTRTRRLAKYDFKFRFSNFDFRITAPQVA